MFGYNLIDNNDKIHRIILSNRRLHQTKFYVGKIPAVTLAKIGSSFIANGFLPKHTQLRIPRSTIVSSNRMTLIEVKAGGRQCWMPLNKIGVKTWNLGISFRKTNDTFIDALNADIDHFRRDGIQPKLYIDNNSVAANKIYDCVTGGRVSRNKKDGCKYMIDGFAEGSFTSFPQSIFIRVIEDIIDVESNDPYRNVIISYGTHFINKERELTTNVAYILPESANFGKPLYGKDYVSQTGPGGKNCADIVFYGDPAVDVDDTTGSIILKPNSPSSPSLITFVKRSAAQPSASNFCYVLSMKPGKSISRPKKIKNAELKFTFSSRVENDPKVVKKGTTIGPIPPGAAGGV